MAYHELMSEMRKILSLVLAAVLIFPASSVQVLAYDDTSYEDITLIRGDVFSTEVSGLQRFSIENPDIADISDVTESNVDVIGKTVGQTTLFLWDASGKRTITIRVASEDLAGIRARVSALLQGAGLTGISVQASSQEGKVVLSGRVNEDQLSVLEKTIAPLEDAIINLVQKNDLQDLIQIDMQITEVKNTLDRQLGVDWTTGAQTYADGGRVTTKDSGQLVPSAGEVIPSQDGSLQDLFKIGKFYRFTNAALVAKVNLLIQEGKAKVLSKPRLVVKNGKEAKFLVGGEIPIQNSTSTAGSDTISTDIEWKEYGLSLSITPTIKDGKVDILMMTEIRDVDSSYAGAQAAGAPAFVTRTAQTQLYLDDKQTIVLAGMIKRRTDKIDSRVPMLGKIPVLGVLFRSTKTNTPTEDSEIVISLTPTIIQASGSEVKREIPQAVAIGPVPQVPAEFVESSARNSAELPVLVKNAASSVTMVPGDIRPYAQSIQERLASSVAYPLEARENSWQGTVKLGMIIRNDGSLKDAFVKESSGYDVLDQDAVNTAFHMTPYASFPSDVNEEQVVLTIPIVYSVDEALKNGQQFDRM